LFKKNLKHNITFIKNKKQVAIPQTIARFFRL